MKTVLAALFGVLVSSAFAISGNWLTIRYGGEGFRGEQSAYATMLVAITFILTAASVVLGGFVVARLHNTRGAVSAYIVLELFFGAGMVAEFWSSQAAWYDTIAILFVIPCALLGASLLQPRWLTGRARNTG
jgi:cyanate permease